MKKITSVLFLGLTLIMAALVLIFPITLRLMLGLSLVYLVLFIPLIIRETRNLSKIDILFALFVLFSIISSQINSDIDSLINIVSLALVYFIYTKIFPNIFKNDTLKILSFCIIIIHILIIVLCVIENKYVYSAFSGIYNNPNAFGLVITLLTISLIAILMGNFDSMLQKKPISLPLVVFLLMLLAYSFYLMLLSQSRTALLTNMIIAFFLFLVVVLRNLKSGTSMLKIGLVSGATLLAVIISFVYIVPFKEGISKILLKFDTKSLDLTDGRVDIWKKTFEDSTLFGNGHNYYGDGLGAHNTFVSLLAEYGWISMLLFILFIALCLIKTIRFAFVKEEVSVYFFMPIAITLTFITYSMMEILIFRPIMITLFIVCGLVFNDRVVENKGEFIKHFRSRMNA